MGRKRDPKAWEENRRKLQALIDQHGSIRTLAESLGCSRQAVWDKIKTYELKYNREAFKDTRIKKIAEDARLVIRKVFVNNLTYSEAAKSLGCTPNHVFDMVRRFISAPAKEALETRLKETYSANVHSLRMVASMTQKELAEKVGIRQSYLSEIERGETGVTNDLLEKIAKVLNVETSILLRPLRYEEIATRWGARS